MTVLRVARDALADARRERIVAVVVLYAAALALLAPWVADLSLAASTRAVRDLGLTLGWAMASGAAIWLGIRTIGWELRSRAAALVLSGPVSRRAWLAGRSLGVLVVLGAVVAAVTGAYAAVALALGAGAAPDLLWYAALLWAECAVIAGMAALLGLLVAPGVAVACTLALWAAGHLANEYTAATEQTPLLARLVFAVVPDLDLFVVQAALVHGDPIDPARSALALLYGILWVTGLLSVAAFVVDHTDIA